VNIDVHRHRSDRLFTYGLMYIGGDEFPVIEGSAIELARVRTKARVEEGVYELIAAPALGDYTKYGEDHMELFVVRGGQKFAQMLARPSDGDQIVLADPRVDGQAASDDAEKRYLALSKLVVSAIASGETVFIEFTDFEAGKLLRAMTT